MEAPTMPTRHLLPLAAALLLTPFLGCRARLDWQEEHDLAIAALESGQIDSARQHLSNSSRKAEQAGTSHLFFEHSMLSLARAQKESGMLQDAERNFRRAYVIREARLGRESTELAEILVPLAEICETQGNTAAATNMREHLATITPEV
jgi:hypothetical protein